MTTSSTTTTTCAPTCGNGICETGEIGVCDCGDVVPVLPAAVGSCLLDGYPNAGTCDDLPVIRIPAVDGAACLSSLSSNPVTAAALVDLLPSWCCADDVCGGDGTVRLSVGDTANTVNGQLDLFLRVLAGCPTGSSFTVPVVACDACGKAATVVGFTRVVLESVTTTGPQKGFALARQCLRCPDGVCSTDETCRTCWPDCGPCDPVCE